MKLRSWLEEPGLLRFPAINKIPAVVCRCRVAASKLRCKNNAKTRFTSHKKQTNKKTIFLVCRILSINLHPEPGRFRVELTEWGKQRSPAASAAYPLVKRVPHRLFGLRHYSCCHVTRGAQAPWPANERISKSRAHTHTPFPFSKKDRVKQSLKVHYGLLVSAE